MRDTLNVIKTVVGIKNFELYSIFINKAFLQGDSLERNVFMKPSKEFAVPGMLWKLKKSFYGMAEAARIGNPNQQDYGGTGYPKD